MSSSAKVVELPHVAEMRERSFLANELGQRLQEVQGLNYQYELIFDKIARGKYATQTQIMRDYNKIKTPDSCPF